MNISGQIGAANYRILDARYALMNCLAVSAAGELYQGRDLERVNDSSQESRVLIHILPTHWAASFNTELAYRDLGIALDGIKNKQVLRVLNYGVYGATSYFVLESPPERNLQALAKVSQDVVRLQQKTRTFLDNLGIKQVLGLEPGLVLLTPEENLYVTSTVLLPNLVQDLSVPITHTAPRQPRLSKKQVGAVGVLSLGAMAAAASVVGWYHASSTPLETMHLTSAATPTLYPPASTSMVNHSTSIKIQDLAPNAVLADVPVDKAVKPMAEPPKVAPPEPIATLKAPLTPSKTAHVAITDKPAKLQQAAKLEKTLAVTKTKALTEDTTPAKAKALAEAQQAAKQAAREAQAAEKARQANQAKKLVAPIANLTAVQPALPPAVSVADVVEGDVDQVIQAAYAAAARGKLHASSGGALYYLRQLRGLDRLHPQIKRIAREIASQYHNHVRDLLAQGRGGDALPSLRNAKSVIMEFNLAEMNSAHDVLLHKVGSF